MGHDNLGGLSPAHRRNPSLASPSASMFRRLGSQAREEIDLSWWALFQRHRFLLITLALLAFLCTIYLYFAITLGDNCSVLVGIDKASCLSKKEKIRRPLLRRRSRTLLRMGESFDALSLNDCSLEYAYYAPCKPLEDSLQPCRRYGERPPFCRIPAPLDNPHYITNLELNTQQPEMQDQALASSDSANAQTKASKLPSSMRLVLENGKIARALNIGCKGQWVFEELLQDTAAVFVFDEGSLDCNELLLRKKVPSLHLDFFQQYVAYPNDSFDAIFCFECHMPSLTSDTWWLQEVERLLHPNGYFLLKFEDSQTAPVYLNGFLSFMKITSLFLVKRSDDTFLWQKQSSSSLERKQSKIELPSAVIQPMKLSQADQVLESNDSKWRKLIHYQYDRLVGSQGLTETRRILDMNSLISSQGIDPADGFIGNDAGNKRVMNVVPFSKMAIDGGSSNSSELLNFQHDWCQAFPSLPRTYDLIHAHSVFALLVDRCEFVDVLLEVDRLLRSRGFIIMIDELSIANKVSHIAKQLLKWEIRSEYTDKTSGLKGIYFQK